jgi:hypothetical protein
VRCWSQTIKQEPFTGSLTKNNAATPRDFGFLGAARKKLEETGYLEMKRTILSVVVGFLFLGVISHLIHSIWPIPIYSHYELIWALRGDRLPHRWLLWLGQLIFIVVFIWIYGKGFQTKPWPGQGLRYGLLITLLTVVPAACTNYAFYPVPFTLLAKWIAAGGLQLILLGLVVAGLCKRNTP